MPAPGVNGFYPLSAAGCIAAFAGADPTIALSTLSITWLLVAAHEFGHAVAARRVGFDVESVAVLPIYGCTTLNGDDRGRGYLTVVLMGPAAGLAASLAALLALAVAPPLAIPGLGEWVMRMLVLGAIDNALNLVPVGVLDGAKALRTMRGLPGRGLGASPVMAPAERGLGASHRAA